MGAGLGWGRRWPWSWESAYLKALSSLSVSPFSFHFFFPPLRLGGATGSLQPWGVGAHPPHPALEGRASAHWPASAPVFLWAV